MGRAGEKRNHKMKLRLERNGTVFEYEKKPMPEGRFKALCGIVAGAMGISILKVIASSCGAFGVISVGIIVLLGYMMKKMAE